MRKEELAIRLELFESIFNGGKIPDCNPALGGTPRCALGQVITGHWKPKCVQINGRSLEELESGTYTSVYKINNSIPKYKIFIITDAPGRNEDATGLAIAGDSFQLLKEICKKAGLPFDQVFITNVTRCRPPKNRQPSAKEIKACLVHLYHDIDKHKPEIIILAGRTALSVFNIREGGINKVRGKLFEKPLPYWPDGPVFKIIPTLNPGAVLRRDDRKLQNRVTDDFRIAKALLDNKEPKIELYKPIYKPCLTVQDVKDAVETILNHGSFAFDTESPDLKIKSSPMMITQLSIGKDKTWIIPFYRHDPNSVDEFKLRSQFTNEEREEIKFQLKRIFENEGIIKFGHHIKYDNNVIKRWLDIHIKGDFHDTQVLHHLLDCYPPHDLKYLADMEFATGNYAAEVEAVVGKGKDLNKTWDNVPDEILWPYSATDAEVSYRLGELYLNQVRDKANLWKLYQEESFPAIKAFEDAEWEGVKVEVSNLNKLEVYYREQLEKSESAAVTLTGVPDFNPHSPEKVKNALIARGLAKEIEAPLTASKYSANKEVLLKLDDELAELVLKCRKYRKRLSTYVERVLTDIHNDGRVRYTFNLSGTVSGRQSCRVYHQMPKLSDEKGTEVYLRSIFCEDDEYDIVFSDFSQIELRIFAYLTGDEQLIKALENNEDIHAGTAGDAIGIPIQEVSDFNRSLGKCIDPSTIVIVNNTPICIRELLSKEVGIDTFTDIINKSVYTYLDRTANIKSIYNGGVKPTKIISTNKGFIKCSNEHRFQLANGNLVKAEELKIGDYLYEDRPKIDFQIEKYPELQYIHRNEKVPNTFIKTDNNLAYICGLIIGDGSINYHNVTISHGDINKKDAYGFSYKEWQDCLYTSLVQSGFSPFKKSEKLYLGSRQVVNYFESLGITKWKDKNNACKIFEIPNWIIKSGREGFLHFLGGLIDTDGYVNKNGNIDLTSKSAVLMGQISALSSIYRLNFTTQRELNKQYNKPYYTILFTKESSVILKPYIRNIGKKNRLSNPIKKIKTKPMKVLFIEDSGLDNCIDLSIDSIDHLYWTNNIITHNSLNFGGLYGSKGSKIADCKFENPKTGKIEVVGEERAKRFIENFTLAHPKIKEFMQEVPDEALAMNCVVRSCFGRQRRIPDLTSRHLGIREAAEREAVNFKVQSPATSICTRTIVEVKKVLDYYNIGSDKVRFLITVHDSLLYGVRKDHTEWFKKVLKQIAERPIKEIKNKTFPINIGHGRTWADAELASKDS